MFPNFALSVARLTPGAEANPGSLTANANELLRSADEEVALRHGQRGLHLLTERILRQQLERGSGFEDGRLTVVAQEMDPALREDGRGGEVTAEAFLPDDFSGCRLHARCDPAVAACGERRLQEEQHGPSRCALHERSVGLELREVEAVRAIAQHPQLPSQGGTAAARRSGAAPFQWRLVSRHSDAEQRSFPFAYWRPASTLAREIVSMWMPVLRALRMPTGIPDTWWEPNSIGIPVSAVIRGGLESPEE